MGNLIRARRPSYGIWAFFAIIAATLGIGAYDKTHHREAAWRLSDLEAPYQELRASLVETGTSVSRLPGLRYVGTSQRSLSPKISEWARVAVRSTDGDRVSRENVTVSLRDDRGRLWPTGHEWMGNDVFVFISAGYHRKPDKLLLTVANGLSPVAVLTLPVDLPQYHASPHQTPHN